MSSLADFKIQKSLSVSLFFTSLQVFKENFPSSSLSISQG